VLELDLGPSWMRGILLLLGVAALAGLLGYLLIGRHAAEELAGEDAPRPDDSAAAEPEPAAGAAGERAAAAAADDPEPGLVTPAAQQRSATLKVTSDPADAKVYIDGELRGVTPTTVRGLPAEGEFELRIELAEHKLWEQTITLDGTDLERQVHAGLITADRCLHGTGFLYVRSQPPGAVIELDGKRLPGKTPKVINDVCAGVPIELRLYRVGYRPWRKQVRIEADDIHNLEAELQK
jgi:hypothetical protein